MVMDAYKFTQLVRLHSYKPGKLAQCIPIQVTILGKCTRNGANAGPIFLVCRDSPSPDLEVR